MCDQFSIDDKVGKFLVSTLGLDNIHDFRTLVTTSADLEDKVISKVDGLQFKDRNLSRLRQAWDGICASVKEAEALKRKGNEDPDLDTLLGTPELDNLKSYFWKRYHVVYPANIEPSDFLVSRVHKEMAKRLLQVHSVYKVRNWTHQLKAERKKQKLNDTLELNF